MEINFVNHTLYDVDEFEKLITKIFNIVDDDREFNVIFTTNEEIRNINREYRNIDRVTDVISFALLDNDEASYNAQDELGDIFICIDRAREQAQDYGHSIEREVGFLSVHGYLHLCGYDHMTEADEQVMFARQDEILNKAKLYR